MAVCAMRCGCSSVLAISPWGRDHGPRISKAWKFKRSPLPCNSTLPYVFRELDVDAFQKVVGPWLESTPPDEVHAALEAVGGKQAMALEGKTLRGSDQGPEAPAVALVAAFLHRSGQVVDQEKVPEGDELAATRALLPRVDLEGRIVTGDALLTQRDVSQTILEKGGTTV